MWLVFAERRSGERKSIGLFQSARDAQEAKARAEAGNLSEGWRCLIAASHAPAHNLTVDTSHFPSVFRQFRLEPPKETEDFYVNSFGARMRKHYMPREWIDYVTRLQPSEDLLEWADILSAVLAARGTFRMMYFGAGFGRWLVNAARAARQKELGVKLIGIEAEDTHHAWMLEHFRDNDIPASSFVAINAPVSNDEKDVFFAVGDSTGWYGQSILPTKDAAFGDHASAAVVARRAVAARAVIEAHGPLDALHADIQGEEATVFPSCIDSLNRLVKRVHIGTHSPAIDRTLTELFTAAGWEPSFTYPTATSGVPTPFGAIDFQDGIQSWINRRLTQS